MEIPTGDEEEYIRIVSLRGYVFDWQYELRYWALGVCTCFLSCLILYWFPRLLYGFRYRCVPCLSSAEYIGAVTAEGETEFLTVEQIKIQPDAYKPTIMGKIWYGPTGINEKGGMNYVEPRARMFLFRHHRFFLDPDCGTFIRQHEPLQEAAGVLTNRIQTGLSTEEHQRRQRTFGINQLQIMVPTYPALLVREFFHPFFMFQLYSVILWCFEVSQNIHACSIYSCRVCMDALAWLLVR